MDGRKGEGWGVLQYGSAEDLQVASCTELHMFLG